VSPRVPAAGPGRPPAARRRIFLVGFMGSGKTTTGRALARRLETLFWDLDTRIETRLGMSVAEVFVRRGEAAFRAEETRQLVACGRIGSLVVATGGGTFCSQANREVMQRLGVSVFLDVSWRDVLRRLPGKREERPLFAAPEQAHALYRARLPFYRLADLHVRPESGEDAEALAARLSILLESRV
jgi:shikimate kinase